MNNTAEHFTQDQTFVVEFDGERYEVPRYCPHRAGRLDHGNINCKSKTITCPLHRSAFKIDSGRRIAGPKCGNLDVLVIKTDK